MTRRQWVMAAVVSLAALARCSAERDMLGNPIDGSHKVDAFAVLDSGKETLWRITAPSVPSLEHLEYGQVPGGFIQEVPNGGIKPRPLVQGEKLIVVIATPEFVYRGEGEAGGATELKIRFWESARPDRITIERALRGEKIGAPS